MSTRRVAASALPAVIAWGEARFPADEWREMAGVGAARADATYLAVQFNKKCNAISVDLYDHGCNLLQDCKCNGAGG